MPSGWDNYKKIVCLETQQNLMGSCSNCLYCFSLLILLFSPNVKVFINAIETEYSKYGVCKKKTFSILKKNTLCSHWVWNIINYERGYWLVNMKLPGYVRNLTPKVTNWIENSKTPHKVNNIMKNMMLALQTYSLLCNV